ncbi:unnamed protein product [Penicillium pancosmium]
MDSPGIDRAMVEPQCNELFREIEAKFKSSDISPDKCSITTTSEPHMAEQLYLYLISQPTYSSADAHKALTRRIREALFKGIVLLGLPKPTEALIAISRLEAEDGLDQTFSREGWKCDEDNYNHGMAWLTRLYAHNADGLFSIFKRHRDFGFWVANIAYGLHLADRQNLDDIDTELVVLPAVMGQNLPRETYWHMRGIRRLGVSKKDVEMVCDCVHRVAQFCGTKLDRVPAVQTVEEEL